MANKKYSNNIHKDAILRKIGNELKTTDINNFIIFFLHYYNLQKLIPLLRY